ncbi:MAG: hypothetical protein IJV36_05325 [Prevotella sp.]|nr:hypothetical protein [Prevotella sp.]
MKEKEYIQKLLDSYMAAETTKEEEQLLSDYFSTHRDIPAEWRNISVMFRSIRQYRQKPDASHRRRILKWSAAAAVIAFIFGTGLLFMREEVTDKPSNAIAQIAESPIINVLEHKQEIIAEEAPVIDQPQARQNTRKRHVSRTQKAIAQVNQSEPLPDISLPVQNSMTSDASIRSLTSHRDGMRSNIQATFENSNIFIAQKSVEL